MGGVQSLIYSLTLARDPLVNSAVYHPQWSHCAIPTIQQGSINEGPLNDTLCVLNKTVSESFVRVVFNGNLRMTNCENCCMRWYITINGEECSDPAPIEAVIFSSNAQTVNVHRGSTIAGASLTLTHPSSFSHNTFTCSFLLSWAGICRGTEKGPLSVEPMAVLLNVGMCDGFNETFNAFTGFSSLSTINIAEMPAGK